MRKQLISICIPCYNGEKYLEETFNSFLNQTYRNFEIVIVDDFSRDKSSDIIREYEKIDSRIKAVYLKQNTGAAAARNTAFLASVGTHIIFHDCDDLVNNLYLEKHIELGNGNLKWITACELIEFYDNDINKNKKNPRQVRITTTPLNWLLLNNADGLNFTSCNMFCIPRNLIQKAGLWNEKLSLIDDFEFYPRLLMQADKIVYNPESLTYYRKGIKGSLSMTGGDKSLQSAYDSIHSTTKFLLEKDNSERLKTALANYWRPWIYNFYLSNKTLYLAAMTQFASLDQQRYSPKNAGVTGLLDSLVGWKLTKKIKTFINR